MHAGAFGVASKESRRGGIPGRGDALKAGRLAGVEGGEERRRHREMGDCGFRYQDRELGHGTRAAVACNVQAAPLDRAPKASQTAASKVRAAVWRTWLDALRTSVSRWASRMAAMAPWAMVAPLGSPVEPEVKMT